MSECVIRSLGLTAQQSAIDALGPFDSSLFHGEYVDFFGFHKSYLIKVSSLMSVTL